MTSSTSPVGRPAERSNLIVDELRAQIVRGELAPGSQLPTRSEIERRYSASTITVQRALERLRQDGFVQVQGRQGTFVAEHPPHLTRYALVFPADQTEPTKWVRWWTALEAEARKLQGTTSLSLPMYHNVTGPPVGDDYERLLEDVRLHRVAGIIFAANPMSMRDTALMDPSIPRVALMSLAGQTEIARVATSNVSFYEKAIEYLASRGRKRLAVANPVGLSEVFAPLEGKLKAHGMKTKTIWQQEYHVAAPQTARNGIHLLMHEGQDERPDCLIVADDNLLEQVTAGLVDAGVRVPQDVEVVAHCNFPYPTPSFVPVRRLGFDARQVLNACIEIIDRQRQNQPYPNGTLLEAQFEDELVAPVNPGSLASLLN